MKIIKSYEINTYDTITLMIEYGDRETPFQIEICDGAIVMIQFTDADGIMNDFIIYDREDMMVAEAIRKWLDENLPMVREIILKESA